MKTKTEAMELVAGESMLTVDYWMISLTAPTMMCRMMATISCTLIPRMSTGMIRRMSSRRILERHVGSTLIVGVDEDAELEVEIGKVVKGQTSINFRYDTDVDDDVQDLDEDAELSALLFLDTSTFLIPISSSLHLPNRGCGRYRRLLPLWLVGGRADAGRTVAVGKGDDEVEVEISREAGDTLGQ
jgi:hypothetical protein